ncbi:hypothetical protein RHE_CH00499 [Rhizobium etli CFN 42]|uniref:Uncharacterized protein n=2 Tax=Rhizobium etli TaxID=29449 RepID=Q2KCW6_RHIEC|nr:hypothetical protein RHE_CH00499 [Rhizobium etli CFN 42]
MGFGHNLRGSTVDEGRGCQATQCVLSAAKYPEGTCRSRTGFPLETTRMEKTMSCKLIAISLLSIGLAGSALAQTAGGANSSGRLSVAPVIGGSGSSGTGSASTGSVGTGAAGTGSVGTDPGTTGSTPGTGGVDLNRDRSTINPGGVNPDLQQVPGCTAGTGSLSEACQQ